MCTAGVDHIISVSLTTFTRRKHCYAGRATHQALSCISSSLLSGSVQ